MFGGFCQPHSFSHQVFIQPNQKCSRPGSNRGPCACEAHVITTTPREQADPSSGLLHLTNQDVFFGAKGKKSQGAARFRTGDLLRVRQM